jgi:hypothetical protein
MGAHILVIIGFFHVIVFVRIIDLGSLSSWLLNSLTLSLDVVISTPVSCCNRLPREEKDASSVGGRTSRVVL